MPRKRTLPKGLKRQSFEDQLAQLNEDIRVMKERSRFFLSKLYALEDRKNAFFKDLHKYVGEYDYGNAREILETYQRMLAKEEIPWTKNYNGFITEHVITVTKSMRQARGRVSGEFAGEIQLLFDFFKKIQINLNKRLVESEAELPILTECLEAGITIKWLSELHNHDLIDEELDVELESIRSSMVKFVYTITAKVGVAIVTLRKEVDAFKKKLAQYEALQRKGAQVEELKVELQEMYADMQARVPGLRIIVGVTGGALGLLAAVGLKIDVWGKIKGAIGLGSRSNKVLALGKAAAKVAEDIEKMSVDSLGVKKGPAPV